MIADAWLVATVSAELAGCAKSRAIADALTPIVELLHASEILDPAPLSLPHLIAEFFADMGLEAPPPKALPKLQARTFAQGVATGRTLERVEVFKRNRKFRRK
jgi:hypothetical protein